jgi:hypothetical protein
MARRRRLNLPREICFVPRKRLSLPQGWLTAEQKSAEGIGCAEQRIVQEGSSPSGARMRSIVSKSVGNASLAEEEFSSEGRVSVARRNPKGMRRSTGP